MEKGTVDFRKTHFGKEDLEVEFGVNDFNEPGKELLDLSLEAFNDIKNFFKKIKLI